MKKIYLLILGLCTSLTIGAAFTHVRDALSYTSDPNMTVLLASTFFVGACLAILAWIALGIRHFYHLIVAMLFFGFLFGVCLTNAVSELYTGTVFGTIWGYAGTYGGLALLASLCVIGAILNAKLYGKKNGPNNAIKTDQ